MNINYVKYKDIDKQEWDKHLASSVNGLLYGCSWFLDIVCNTWDALIADDYTFFLPLPIKYKFLFPIINSPPYTNRYNIFGNTHPNMSVYHEFAKKIHEKFIGVSFNFGIHDLASLDDFKISYRLRQELYLEQTYDQLYAKFKKSHKKNIKKANSKGIFIRKTKNAESIVAMKRAVHQLKSINISEKHYDMLHKIASVSCKYFGGQIYEAIYEGELVSATFFAEFNRRYTIFSGNNFFGRKIGAAYCLINEFLKTHANSKCILDFAGSNITGIRYRNEGFGAKSQRYCSVSKSNLIYKIAKKIV